MNLKNLYLSPARSPAVFDKPVVTTVFSAITNHNHSMVNTTGIATARTINTSRVGRKSGLTSVNAHRDGSELGHGLF